MSTVPRAIDAEDQPPMLRFSQTSLPDPVATLQTGRPCYMNAIMVDVSAAGDIKNVVPYVAEKTKYTESEIEGIEIIPTTSFRIVDGKEESFDKNEEVKVKKKVYSGKRISPWLETLRGRLKANIISQNYYDYCAKALDHFKKNMNIPEEGTPLGPWTAFMNEAVKRKAIEIGINTVEKAASMNEQAMEAIGMQARELKRVATAYLETDRDSERAALNMLNMERQLEANKDHMSALEAKIKELEASQAKPRGRPRRDTEEAEDEAA